MLTPRKGLIRDLLRDFATLLILFAIYGSIMLMTFAVADTMLEQIP